MIDWQTIGAGLGGLAVGAMSYFAGRGKREVAQAEDSANVELLQGLVTRVQSLESSLADMSRKLDEEVAARMAAQEQAHRLRLRVITLESAMRSIGAVIPPEVTP